MFKKKKKGEEATEGEEKEGKGEEAEAPKKEGEEGASEGGEGEGAPKKGKKKLIIIAGAVVLVLVIVGVLFAIGVIGGKKPELDEHGNPIVEEKELSPEEKAAKEAAAAEAAKPVYYELPEFLVNLNSGTSRVSFLKMTVTLELRDKAAVTTIDNNKPRVQDVFNTYLRELRPTDIQGSAGIYRLRTDLISRLNSTIEDGVVKDILFGEIIVQ